MNTLKRIVIAGLLAGAAQSATADPAPPVAGKDLVFEESNGIVAVEAEHFIKQTLTEKRAWHRTSSQAVPDEKPDSDPPHLENASGGVYLECLPDSRATHDDKLIRGENFSPEPGKMAVLHYKIHFNTPGRYYVWVRAHSTGPEDNGLHVGLNGAWPETGQRLQWCDGKRTWRWESKQRTEKEHCGEPYKIYLDIAKPGEHEVMFSMREDGFEFDKFILTTTREFRRPANAGPASKVKSGQLPPPPAPAKGDNGAPKAPSSPPLEGSSGTPRIDRQAGRPSGAEASFQPVAPSQVGSAGSF